MPLSLHRVPLSLVGAQLLPPPDNIEALFSLTFSSTDDILHMLAREAPVQMGIARIAIRSPPRSHLGLL